MKAAGAAEYPAIAGAGTKAGVADGAATKAGVIGAIAGCVPAVGRTFHVAPPTGWPGGGLTGIGAGLTGIGAGLTGITGWLAGIASAGGCHGCDSGCGELGASRSQISQVFCPTGMAQPHRLQTAMRVYRPLASDLP